MDTDLARAILETIRREQDLRTSLLDDNSEIAYDHWNFKDAPFLAELCLILLVALYHQIERELLGLAARAADNGQEIEPDHYETRIKELRQGRGRGLKWDVIKNRLKLGSCVGYDKIESLRFLANCYKHEPTKQPDNQLLTLLGLETGVRYAPLPESWDLQEGFARFIGLEPSAGYCQIVEKVLDTVDAFLADVKQKVRISRVKWRGASLDPRDFAR